MRKRPIKPVLASYELEDFWDEGSPDSDTFDPRPGSRWFASYDIYSYDKNQPNESLARKAWRRLSANYNSFPGFFLHYCVCSPEMFQDPPTDLSAEIATAFVQKQFNQDEAIINLKNRLNAVSAKNDRELRTALQTFLYILPTVRV